MVFCMFTRPDNQSVYRYSHPSTVKLFWLVVEPPTPLKNMSSSNGITVPNIIYIYMYIWKNKKCSKPATSINGIRMAKNVSERDSKIF